MSKKSRLKKEKEEEKRKEVSFQTGRREKNPCFQTEKRHSDAGKCEAAARPRLALCTSFLFGWALTRPADHKRTTSARLENMKAEAGYDIHAQHRK